MIIAAGLPGDGTWLHCLPSPTQQDVSSQEKLFSLDAVVLPNFTSRHYLTCIMFIYPHVLVAVSGRG